MENIKQLIAFFGSQEKLADALQVKQPTVSDWLRGRRPISAKHCIQLELITNGQFKAKDLRPDIYHITRKAKDLSSELNELLKK